MCIYGYQVFYETILMYTNMFMFSSSVPLKKKMLLADCYIYFMIYQWVTSWNLKNTAIEIMR